MPDTMCAGQLTGGFDVDRPIMLGKGDDLGIELRIEPISLGDGGPQVVDLLFPVQICAFFV